MVVMKAVVYVSDLATFIDCTKFLLKESGKSFTANTDSQTIKRNEVFFFATEVRLRPRSTSSRIAMRLEIYGCPNRKHKSSHYGIYSSSFSKFILFLQNTFSHTSSFNNTIQFTGILLIVSHYH